MSDLKPDRQRRDLHKSNLPVTSRKIRPVCRLVLWNRVLEPSIDIRNNHICNFRLRVFTFLLVFFDSLAGKAFLARSIKLCLVDNQ
jgi:hypothetical protein